MFESREHQLLLEATAEVARLRSELRRYEDVVRAAMAFDEGGDFGALTAACARLRLSEGGSDV